MKAQHTPGPWQMVGNEDGYLELIAPGPRRLGVFSKRGFSYRERKANARLIAAAPELLAALRDVIGWIPGSSAWHTDAARKSVENARAVLAQATGAES